MDRLTVIVALAVGLMAMPAPAADLERWRPFIVEASQRFDIPESWIFAVIEAESDGNPRDVSPKGAKGLMQLMPATWAEMRRQHDLGADVFDPRDNILAGAAYLRAMRDRFGYPGLFAAYNAGPARYQAHLDGRSSLPEETRKYVARLAKTPPDSAKPPAVLSGTRLFFPLNNSGNPAASAGLFVPLNTISTGK